MKKIIILTFLVIFGLTNYCSADDNSLSLSFIGSYKKAMRFYPELKKYSEKYKVDLKIILAIAMVESGGNNDLVSSAKARSLMQVIPRTYRAMMVDSRIEAGVKYFKILSEIFDKTEEAVSAYHAGPLRVKRKRIPKITKQYTKNVMLYYGLLSSRQEKKQIEKQAENLKITVLTKAQTWEQLAQKYNCSVIELRLYNSFLAFFDPGVVSKERKIVYPRKSTKVVKKGFYTTRKGDLAPLLRNAFSTSKSDFDVNIIKPGMEIFVGAKE